MNKYFEGWYFKHQKGGEVLSIIAGRAANEAFIQVITGEGSYRVTYPPESYRKGKTLCLAANRFAGNGIRLSIHNKDLTLTGQLSYSGITPIKGDIMGPFRFLPMECRHTVISMRHELRGKVWLNGKELDFTGGKGYIEGDFGRSFPKSYTWVQSSAFNGDCSIMASAAHIPFACPWFWGCACAVWLNGAEYRLATYRGARIKERNERRLLIEQGDLSLRIRFLGLDPGHLLDAPSQGEMNRRIRENPCAPAYFEFCRGGKTLFSEKSSFASYEYVV